MNKRGHLLNAALLSLGLAVLFGGGRGLPTVRTLLAVGVPVTLGSLIPDIDTAVGSHRKTFHNLLTLGTVAAFPIVFGNLRYVWIGVLTHYVLDLLGAHRGIALFYPWPAEYDVPVGVDVDSPLADVVTLLVTGVELAVVWAVLETGVYAPVLEAARSVL